MTTGGLQLHGTVVDGVRTVWADLPGPLRAGLLLRVGQADESFVTAGTTHLMEHLALSGVGRPGDHSNGTTAQTWTEFVVEGDAERVTGFLATVSRALHHPPLDRLAAERDVLRAERARAAPNADAALASWRYGALTYGLTGFDEPGADAVTAQSLAAWASTFAATDNCLLWLTGPPPAGLRLHVPPGPGIAPPDPARHFVHGGGRWVRTGDGLVAADAVVGHGAAAAAYAAILGNRLVDTLRVRRSVSYAPDAGVERLTGAAGRLVAAADVLAGKGTDAVDAFLEVVDGLAGHRPATGAELDAWRADVTRHDTDRRGDAARLRSAAIGFLLGDGFVADPLAHGRWVRDALTPDEVAAVARQVRQGALAVLPDGVQVLRPGWTAWEPDEPDPVPGVPHAHAEAPEVTATLLTGAAGLTLRRPGGTFTAPVARSVAVQRWPDGRRVLIRDDGATLVVEPTMWAGGAGLADHVDATWPVALRLDQPARMPGAVPTPRARDELVRPPRWYAAMSTEVTLGIAVFLALGLLLVQQAVHDRKLAPALVAVGALLMAGGIAFLERLRLRRTRRR